MIAGVFLVAVGALLVIAPLAAGRAANALRFVPYRTDRRHVRDYRIAGGVIAVAGVLVVLLTSR